MMSTDTQTRAGYYRYPTIAHEKIVFVSEDDLWLVSRHGGLARRLSSGLGRASHPALSPDGEWLAFSSTEEGHAEIFVMSAEGGAAERLTFIGSDTRVIGWTSNDEIVFASNHQQAFTRLTDIYTISRRDRIVQKVPCGPATHVDFDPQGRLVIARHGGTDLAYWKRYRGGRAGEIWVDQNGNGTFEKLLRWPANTARPYWVGNRIYFISDHDGVGNIYSVREDGTDLKRHTNSTEYYVRGLAASGSVLVFHAGAELYVLDTQSDSGAEKVEIEYRSPRTQLNRRFVSASRYLEDYDLHPNGERAVLAARGKTFSFGLWKGPVFMHGQEGALRSRLGRFLNDGERVLVVSDAGGEEALEIHDCQNRERIERLDGLDLGRTTELKVSPVADEAALVNHRNELILVQLQTHESRILDSSLYSRIHGFNWSPDGQYIAYSAAENERTMAIRICDVRSGDVHRVTRPLLRDVRPFFDPEGDYLYFLSYREFDPVYDSLHFDLGFPRGCRPYFLTLRKDVLSPFSPDNTSRGDKKKAEKNHDVAEIEKESPRNSIDFDGIEDRILPLPLGDGRYGQLAASRDKVYVTRFPIEGSLDSDLRSSEPSARAHLEMLDLATEKVETLVSGVTSFRLSQDGKFILYRSGHALRVMKAGEKPGRDQDDFRRQGWIDLARVQVPVRPREEWRQMYREAWRLQRDHFWAEDMSRVDWDRVYERYLPLLERAGSRSEVSDLIWEMQGELGTSHAYEIGGDYRPDPFYGVGFLGAEFEYDEAEAGYRLLEVMPGDIWDEACSSPLARAGVELKSGDVLLAIDGQPLSRQVHPFQCLVHRAGKDISLTFRRRGRAQPQTLSIRTLRSEKRLRYREWVKACRRHVHIQSKGRIGYVHIPNMGPFGYSEFHRAFLTELDREGLIVDVRFNGGGHVSQLLLEKLARRRIGYSKSRWFGVQPYPEESPAGPMVAITNEYAGSDGDIFSHSFKLLRLGPLIGKRTWGGVVGISPSHSLVDGGMTTQPEYSFWFEDVGWKVENFGTEPDLEVEYAPSDYLTGRDPQLESAIEHCLEQIDRNPPPRPFFDETPDLSLPTL